MVYPGYTADIDYSDEIAAVPKHIGYSTLPPRTQTDYVTLHYSGVNYVDRSHQAELDRILDEARYQLHHDYGIDEPAYPDGLLYDCVILSDGTCVRTRAHPQQLWHCGNELGNAQSFALHLMLGPSQDATPVQWQRVLRVIDEVRDTYTFPVMHIVGHNEWPRHNGVPQPSAVYKVLPEQSVCPGHILHARLAAARAAASIVPHPPMPPSDATPEPVLPPLPATPAAARTYRVILNKSWVRALPSTSKGTFIKALGLNSKVEGWLVSGEPVTSKAGVTSDQWLRLADDSGYIWAGQVKETMR